jgi:hypothetical protein
LQLQFIFLIFNLREASNACFLKSLQQDKVMNNLKITRKFNYERVACKETQMQIVIVIRKNTCDSIFLLFLF